MPAPPHLILTGPSVHYFEGIDGSDSNAVDVQDIENHDVDKDTLITELGLGKISEDVEIEECTHQNGELSKERDKEDLQDSLLNDNSDRCTYLPDSDIREEQEVAVMNDVTEFTLSEPSNKFMDSQDQCEVPSVIEDSEEPIGDRFDNNTEDNILIPSIEEPEAEDENEEEEGTGVQEFSNDGQHLSEEDDTLSKDVKSKESNLSEEYLKRSRTVPDILGKHHVDSINRTENGISEDDDVFESSSSVADLTGLVTNKDEYKASENSLSEGLQPAEGRMDISPTKAKGDENLAGYKSSTQRDGNDLIQTNQKGITGNSSQHFTIVNQSGKEACKDTEEKKLEETGEEDKYSKMLAMLEKRREERRKRREEASKGITTENKIPRHKQEMSDTSQRANADLSIAEVEESTVSNELRNKLEVSEDVNTNKIPIIIEPSDEIDLHEKRRRRHERRRQQMRSEDDVGNETLSDGDSSEGAKNNTFSADTKVQENSYGVKDVAVSDVHLAKKELKEGNNNESRTEIESKIPIGVDETTGVQDDFTKETKSDRESERERWRKQRRQKYRQRRTQKQHEDSDSPSREVGNDNDINRRVDRGNMAGQERKSPRTVQGTSENTLDPSIPVEIKDEDDLMRMLRGDSCTKAEIVQGTDDVMPRRRLYSRRRRMEGSGSGSLEDSISKTEDHQKSTSDESFDGVKSFSSIDGADTNKDHGRHRRLEDSGVGSQQDMVTKSADVHRSTSGALFESNAFPSDVSTESRKNKEKAIIKKQERSQEEDDILNLLRGGTAPVEISEEDTLKVQESKRHFRRLGRQGRIKSEEQLDKEYGKVTTTGLGTETERREDTFQSNVPKSASDASVSPGEKWMLQERDRKDKLQRQHNDVEEESGLDIAQTDELIRKDVRNGQKEEEIDMLVLLRGGDATNSFPQVDDDHGMKTTSYIGGKEYAVATDQMEKQPPETEKDMPLLHGGDAEYSKDEERQDCIVMGDSKSGEHSKSGKAKRSLQKKTDVDASYDTTSEREKSVPTKLKGVEDGKIMTSAIDNSEMSPASSKNVPHVSKQKVNDIPAHDQDDKLTVFKVNLRNRKPKTVQNSKPQLKPEEEEELMSLLRGDGAPLNKEDGKGYITEGEKDKHIENLPASKPTMGTVKMPDTTRLADDVRKRYDDGDAKVANNDALSISPSQQGRRKMKVGRITPETNSKPPEEVKVVRLKLKSKKGIEKEPPVKKPKQADEDELMSLLRGGTEVTKVSEDVVKDKPKTEKGKSFTLRAKISVDEKGTDSGKNRVNQSKEFDGKRGHDAVRRQEKESPGSVKDDFDHSEVEEELTAAADDEVVRRKLGTEAAGKSRNESAKPSMQAQMEEDGLLNLLKEGNAAGGKRTFTGDTGEKKKSNEKKMLEEKMAKVEKVSPEASSSSTRKSEDSTKSKEVEKGLINNKINRSPKQKIEESMSFSRGQLTRQSKREESDLLSVLKGGDMGSPLSDSFVEERNQKSFIVEDVGKEKNNSSAEQPDRKSKEREKERGSKGVIDKNLSIEEKSHKEVEDMKLRERDDTENRNLSNSAVRDVKATVEQTELEGRHRKRDQNQSLSASERSSKLNERIQSLNKAKEEPKIKKKEPYIPVTHQADIKEKILSKSKEETHPQKKVAFVPVTKQAELKEKYLSSGVEQKQPAKMEQLLTTTSNQSSVKEKLLARTVETKDLSLGDIARKSHDEGAKPVEEKRIREEMKRDTTDVKEKYLIGLEQKQPQKKKFLVPTTSNQLDIKEKLLAKTDEQKERNADKRNRDKVHRKQEVDHARKQDKLGHEQNIKDNITQEVSAKSSEKGQALGGLREKFMPQVQEGGSLPRNFKTGDSQAIDSSRSPTSKAGKRQEKHGRSGKDTSKSLEELLDIAVARKSMPRKRKQKQVEKMAEEHDSSMKKKDAVCDEDVSRKSHDFSGQSAGKEELKYTKKLPKVTNEKESKEESCDTSHHKKDISRKSRRDLSGLKDDRQEMDHSKKHSKLRGKMKYEEGTYSDDQRIKALEQNSIRRQDKQEIEERKEHSKSAGAKRSSQRHTGSNRNDSSHDDGTQLIAVDRLRGKNAEPERGKRISDSDGSSQKLKYGQRQDRSVSAVANHEEHQASEQNNESIARKKERQRSKERKTGMDEVSDRRQGDAPEKHGVEDKQGDGKDAKEKKKDLLDRWLKQKPQTGRSDDKGDAAAVKNKNLQGKLEMQKAKLLQETKDGDVSVKRSKAATKEPSKLKSKYQSMITDTELEDKKRKEVEAQRIKRREERARQTLANEEEAPLETVPNRSESHDVYYTTQGQEEDDDMSDEEDTLEYSDQVDGYDRKLIEGVEIPDLTLSYSDGYSDEESSTQFFSFPSDEELGGHSAEGKSSPRPQRKLGSLPVRRMTRPSEESSETLCLTDSDEDEESLRTLKESEISLEQQLRQEAGDDDSVFLAGSFESLDMKSASELSSVGDKSDGVPMRSLVGDGYSSEDLEQGLMKTKSLPSNLDSCHRRDSDPQQNGFTSFTPPSRRRYIKHVEDSLVSQAESAESLMSGGTGVSAESGIEIDEKIREGLLELKEELMDDPNLSRSEEGSAVEEEEELLKYPDNYPKQISEFVAVNVCMLKRHVTESSPLSQINRNGNYPLSM